MRVTDEEEWIEYDRSVEVERSKGKLMMMSSLKYWWSELESASLILVTQSPSMRSRGVESIPGKMG